MRCKLLRGLNVVPYLEVYTDTPLPFAPYVGAKYATYDMGPCVVSTQAHQSFPSLFEVEARGLPRDLVNVCMLVSSRVEVRLEGCEGEFRI
jgi:hypothetical protein